ncbi:sensor histidine kinase [uncultured Duncaniella sp.]|uniref:sensor histidine kinase n=1 Tax=uncultured Duncaniella sp. TaxID=2768039 RepID=UPI0025B02387|nr:sensor histidine kinase [uncultured Duncaniella sp.]
MKEILTRQRITTFLTHLLCIIILFILPEILSSLANPGRPIKMWMYTKTFVFIGVFYANYYCIIEQSFDKPRRFLRFFGYNFLLIIVVLGLIYLIWRFKGHLGGRTPLRNHPSPTESMYFAKSIGMLSRDVVMLILVIGFATALRLGDKWLKLDRRRQDLVNMQREEELKNLKSQLNPHFLFNTLNSIYALIAISPTKAQEAVHELSRLLRYVLYDTSATVSLKQELAFIDNYVSLMKLRLSSAIRLNVTLDAGNNETLRVAPLLFITLIENVFKHGIHTPEIPLEISVTAHDNTIECRTSNGLLTSGSQTRLPSSTTEDECNSGGIGLSNLHRRLDLIYGRDAQLNITTTDKSYEVCLKIHIRPNL